MGVVNITPDSFSDGGRFFDPSRAVEHALRLIAEGADILDIGGESTRPGAEPVSAEEELSRVIPVLEAIRPKTEILISIDTYKADVAAKALEFGADIVNDISGFRFDPEMSAVVADSGAGVILMHCRGTPATMATLEPSRDLFGGIERDLQVSVNTAYYSGIVRDKIVLDPGIGFGKNSAENLRILDRLAFLQKFELPILVGLSRKRFIGDVLRLPVEQRLLGTAGASAVAVLRGAHILRVHDVAEIRQVVRVVDAITSERLVG
ncbi:MAG: dihydropteroate synthase [Acidobacteriota bacterium]|nr:MAG: dihydropteroate synthase [Acidobacteriota bacterium]